MKVDNYKCWIFDKNFTLGINYENIPEGMYLFSVDGNVKPGVFQPIKQTNVTRHLLCSEKPLKNNSAQSVTLEDVYTPSILDIDGQPVSEITLSMGSSKTFEIDAYSGHTFKTPCLDKNVCTVSISGTTLTVTGVSEGSTYFGVYDNQNHLMVAAQVTVTAGGGGGGDIVAYTSCPDDHHPHMIDLGLPSGTKWACCNVGAEKPEDSGGYYAWGETTPQSSNRYYWDSYKWCNGGMYTLTKYCNLSSNGNNGFTDDKTVLDAEDDAASANWGGDWRMPTEAEFDELINNTTNEWTTQNGVYGRKFTSKTNGNSIFLPAAGYRWKGELNYAGSDGHYWSSTLYESYPNDARYLYFTSGPVYTLNDSRYDGRSVRPVRK